MILLRYSLMSLWLHESLRWVCGWNHWWFYSGVFFPSSLSNIWKDLQYIYITNIYMYNYIYNYYIYITIYIYNYIYNYIYIYYITIYIQKCQGGQITYGHFRHDIHIDPLAIDLHHRNLHGGHSCEPRKLPSMARSRPPWGVTRWMIHCTLTPENIWKHAVYIYIYILYIYI